MNAYTAWLRDEYPHLDPALLNHYQALNTWTFTFNHWFDLAWLFSMPPLRTPALVYTDLKAGAWYHPDNPQPCPSYVTNDPPYLPADSVTMPGGSGIPMLSFHLMGIELQAVDLGPPTKAKRHYWTGKPAPRRNLKPTG